MRIGGMVWRIGEVLDFYQQIAWFEHHGFEGIAFHTAPCLTGEWASFDVRQASAAERSPLKEALARFAEVSLHGEFDNYDVCLCSPNEMVRQASVQTLRRTLELAAEIGASVVTVHEGTSGSGAPEGMRRAALANSIGELAVIGADAGVAIGFELVRDYDLVLQAEGPVGITLDVGHVSMDDGAGYRRFGSLSDLTRHLGGKLVHVHVHDYDGEHDHLALGAGSIDFAGMMDALSDIGYAGMLCLELNPDRTKPEDYVRGKELLMRLSQI